jgi:hypothetical protein
MTASRFPLILALLAMLAAGCAPNGTQGNLFASAAPSTHPKSAIVTDFVAAPEITATDNGFNTRLESKGGNYPILERRQRTLARVNDEIVATIVADLRAAGIEAQPGNETSLGFNDDALVVTGRLQPPEHKAANQVGFGPGRGNVIADMTVTRASGASHTPATTFAVDVQSGRKLPAGNAQTVAARNSAIAATLAAENALPEKLSPEVEAQARGLGRAIAEKIVTYAKEQGWLETPAAVAESEAAPARAAAPRAKPATKPVAAKPAAAKPAAKPADPNAPEDEEPPDTDVPDQPGSR